MKALSDSTLLKLWRAAVRRDWHNQCAFRSFSPCFGALECHHIVRRARLLTRYERGNGILLCQAHHRYAETADGRRLVASIVAGNRSAWTSERLGVLDTWTAKTYFAEHGITRAEFLVDCAKGLKIEGESKWR